MSEPIAYLVATEGYNPVTALAKADHNIVREADVLEALVYLADPQAECRQIAEQALQLFGSVGAVLSASVPDLITKLGIRSDIAYVLKAFQIGMHSVLKEPICERVSIGSLTQLIDYLGDSLNYKTVEVLRILYLDRKNGLMWDEQTNRGPIDDVPIQPCEIVKRVFKLGASAVIVAHNHPSGDPTPSEADVSFSQEVERALSIMNIALHDSLIVGRNGYTSLRRQGWLGGLMQLRATMN
jgi:DNA repair protein RadC